MANYTDTIGFDKGSAYLGGLANGRLSYLQVKVDFAKVKAARTAASATALAAADTLQVLTLPVDCLVMAGGVNVVLAETTNTTGTLDYGTTGGSPMAANALGDDIASNAISSNTVGLAAPVDISTADTLDILINTAVPQNAIVVFWALVLNYASSGTTGSGA